MRIGEAISFSKINTYMQCPGKYLRKYHLRQKTVEFEPHPNMVIGSLIHEALDVMGQGKTKDIDEALVMGVKLVDKIITPTMLTESKEIMEAWYDETKFNPLPISSEEKFTMDIGDGVTILGYIDRIDKMGLDGIKITDYKTGQGMFFNSDLEGSFQLIMYAIAGYYKYEPSSIQICYDMVRHNREVSKNINMKSIPAYIEMVKKVTKEIEAVDPDEVSYKVSSGCGYCDYRWDCEMLKTYLKQLTDTELTLDMNIDADILAETIHKLTIRKKMDDGRLTELKAWLTDTLDSQNITELKTDDWELGLKYRKKKPYSYVKKLE